MQWKYLEHTADVKLHAYGNTLEECFTNAALAMFEVMTDVKKVKKKVRYTIEVYGNDIKSLLYKFLEELLFLLNTKQFLLSEVAELVIEGYRIKATVLGDRLSDRYETHGEVKAVTYNEMEIHDEAKQKYVQVVLDI
jgi:SHS2 domain-containing protein